MWLTHWIWAAIVIPLAVIDFEVMCEPADDYILVFLAFITISDVGMVFGNWRTFYRFWGQDAETATLAYMRGALVVVSMGVMQIIAKSIVAVLALSALLTLCPSRINGTSLIIAGVAAWSLFMGWWHVRWIGGTPAHSITKAS